MQGWPHPRSSASIGYITERWILKFLFILMVVVFFKFLHPIEFSEVIAFFKKKKSFLKFAIFKIPDQEGLWTKTDGKPAGGSLSPERKISMP